MHKTIYDIAKDREHKVAKHLETLGYTSISVANGKGPDIVCWKDGKRLYIEVKAVYESGCSWIVASVTPARRSDDLIAIILPDGSILLMPMAEHLAFTGKHGTRTVTTLVREMCPQFVRKPFPKSVRGKPRKSARAEIIEILKARGEWPMEAA